MKTTVLTNEQILAQGPVTGSRNTSARRLLDQWKKDGVSEAKAWFELTSWNNESLSDQELSQIFRSVYPKK